MIKVEVHPIADGFLKPLTLELEDWVATEPESVRRDVITRIICAFLNKHKYKGRTDWFPRKVAYTGNNVVYSSFGKENDVSIVTCKIIKDETPPSV